MSKHKLYKSLQKRWLESVLPITFLHKLFKINQVSFLLIAMLSNNFIL